LSTGNNAAREQNRNGGGRGVKRIVRLGMGARERRKEEGKSEEGERFKKSKKKTVMQVRTEKRVGGYKSIKIKP